MSEQNSTGDGEPTTETNTTMNSEPLPAAPDSPQFYAGMSPTPITESFEQWWCEYGEKCEKLMANLGFKAAIERGFFAGRASSKL